MIVLLFVLQSGCAKLQPEVSKGERKLSCEEKAKPKSLEYLEQQYRCTSGD